MDERRTSPRYGKELEVEIVLEGRSLKASSMDVSVGGMRICAETGPVLVAGQKVELRFQLPDLDVPTQVDSEVRWVDRIDPRVAGIRFVQGLRAKEAWAVNRFGG